MQLESHFFLSSKVLIIILEIRAKVRMETNSYFTRILLDNLLYVNL
jgi:hypothetical protein